MQFPYYCKPGQVKVIYVNVGQGWVKTNEFSYHGAVQQDADVKFITEQDGTGQILAKFNSVILKCDGISSMKRKTISEPMVWHYNSENRTASRHQVSHVRHPRHVFMSTPSALCQFNFFKSVQQVLSVLVSNCFAYLPRSLPESWFSRLQLR